MNWLLYGMIFFSKVIENSLATLRLIVVANGKKLLGAILQFIIALVWVLVTGAVVVNIHKDPLKIIFFALGSLVGSYVGSLIEEKMALGSNMLMVIIEKELEENIVSTLRNHGYQITTMDASGMYNNKTVLMIVIARKERRKLVRLIHTLDSKALIISESAKTIRHTKP